MWYAYDVASAGFRKGPKEPFDHALLIVVEPLFNGTYSSAFVRGHSKEACLKGEINDSLLACLSGAGAA